MLDSLFYSDTEFHPAARLYEKTIDMPRVDRAQAVSRLGCPVSIILMVSGYRSQITPSKSDPGIPGIISSDTTTSKL